MLNDVCDSATKQLLYRGLFAISVERLACDIGDTFKFFLVLSHVWGSLSCLFLRSISPMSRMSHGIKKEN
jgi:hypothetical protein